MSEIDVTDISKIQVEVEKIKKNIKAREKEIEQLDTNIEKLEEKKGQLERTKKEEVYKQFGELEKGFTFAQEIRNKMDAFGKAMSRAGKTQGDILILYKKAFKRLSSQRVTIPYELFQFESDYQGSYLTLYPKGFGRSSGEGYPSKYVSDWKYLKRIFDSPDIGDYIIKNDKRDIFYAFSEAVSNWIETGDDIDPYGFRPSKEIFSLKTKAPYISIKERGYSGEVEIKTTEAERITIEKTQEWAQGRGYYDTYRISFDTSVDHFHKQLDELGFGEFYALAHVWKDLEEKLDEEINRYSSIAENNETVLKQLKHAIAIHIVVDEL